LRTLVAFEVGGGGALREGGGAGGAGVGVASAVLLKADRKRVYEEIADSEDEEGDEFGWAEADEVEVVKEELAREGAPGG
jgi:hypothetical protein